jgi:predicted DNA-binding transcriptional regulator YafY
MQTMDEKITVIQEAAKLGQPIGFCYIKQEAGMAPGMGFGSVRVSEVRERRQIIPDPDEPIRTNQAGEQYVIGDDLARGGPRSFTLSKITEVSTV